jgi:hypothetical protein
VHLLRLAAVRPHLVRSGQARGSYNERWSAVTNPASRTSRVWPVSDAHTARDQLLEAVVDFPFEAEIHRAAWFASLLTPLARFAFVVRPLYFSLIQTSGGRGRVCCAKSLPASLRTGDSSSQPTPTTRMN